MHKTGVFVYKGLTGRQYTYRYTDSGEVVIGPTASSGWRFEGYSVSAEYFESMFEVEHSVYEILTTEYLFEGVEEFRIHYFDDKSELHCATVMRDGKGWKVAWDDTVGIYDGYTDGDINRFLNDNWIVGTPEGYVKPAVEGSLYLRNRGLVTTAVVEGYSPPAEASTSLAFYYVGRQDKVQTAVQTADGFSVEWGGPLNSKVWYSTDQVKDFISSGNWVVVGVV
jgi:hypothetical protein